MRFMTPTEKQLNDEICDRGIALFSTGLYTEPKDLLDEFKTEFGIPDIHVPHIDGSEDLYDAVEFVDLTKKIDTTELKANAVKLINKAFDDITAVDPTFEGDIK